MLGSHYFSMTFGVKSFEFLNYSVLWSSYWVVDVLQENRQMKALVLVFCKSNECLVSSCSH